MKVHSQAAFLGDLCDQRRQCTKRQHQRQHKHKHKHPHRRQVQPKTGLFLSGAEDYSIAAAAAAVTTPAVSVSVPIANFDTSSNFEPVVFEPILNVPALVTFVLITTVFSALIVRTNQVEDAVRERKKRQEQVRALKAKEVSSGGENIGSGVGGGSGTTSTTTTTTTTSSSSSITLSEELRQTLKLYEEAVLREEKLRNILPGVRIVPPSASDRKEEEVQAIAKQYLGRDFNIGVPKRYNEEKQERGDNDNGSLPGAAIGVLAVVALSQVGLLAFFVFGADPLSSSSTGGGALM